MTAAPDTTARFTDPRDPTSAPLVTAVIVNWNTGALLEQCLESLVEHGAAGAPLEVVVVDNGSDDGSVELVRRDWPDVALIECETNLGYQKANNLGMAAARGAQLLLINADAFLTAGCLDRLLARMDTDPRCGVVGPRLVYRDGSFQRWTAGREPSLSAAAVFHFGIDRLAVGATRGIYLGRDVREAFQPEWVSSACMLVRARALAETGPMDETFFAYMDDVDLCRRAREADWHVWYEPEAEAIHLMGQSTRREPGAASPLALRTFNRYFARRHGRSRTRLLQGIEAAGFTLRACAHGVRSVRTPANRVAALGHLRNARVSLEAPS